MEPMIVALVVLIILYIWMWWRYPSRDAAEENGAPAPAAAAPAARNAPWHNAPPVPSTPGDIPPAPRVHQWNMSPPWSESPLPTIPPPPPGAPWLDSANAGSPRPPGALWSSPPAATPSRFPWNDALDYSLSPSINTPSPLRQTVFSASPVPAMAVTPMVPRHLSESAAFPQRPLSNSTSIFNPRPARHVTWNDSPARRPYYYPPQVDEDDMLDASLEDVAMLVPSAYQVPPPKGILKCTDPVSGQTFWVEEPVEPGMLETLVARWNAAILWLDQLRLYHVVEGMEAGIRGGVEWYAWAMVLALTAWLWCLKAGVEGLIAGCKWGHGKWSDAQPDLALMWEWFWYDWVPAHRWDWANELDDWVARELVPLWLELVELFWQAWWWAKRLMLLVFVVWFIHSWFFALDPDSMDNDRTPWELMFPVPGSVADYKLHKSVAVFVPGRLANYRMP